MKISKYTIFIHDFPERGKHFLFNTRTLAQVVIDQELLEILQQSDETPLPEKSGEALQKLTEMGLLVANGADENRIIEQWFDQIRQESSEVKATILTTYACNFACPYCLEEGIKRPVSMTEATARRSIAYVQKRIKELSPKSLVITFYGGEPLLNLKAIRLISKDMKAFCSLQGLSFRFNITTNGALLTPRVVDEFKGYGLEGVKITLDGTKEHHNRNRPFKNGRGSFDLLIRNIRYAVERIGVDISGNFDAKNTGSVPGLLDYLKELGLDTKLHKLKFEPIAYTPEKRKGLPPGADIGCELANLPLTHKGVALRRAVLEKGFPTDQGVGIHVCNAVMNDCLFVIDPLGKLFKCPAFVGHKDFEVGDIERGEVKKMLPDGLWKRCLGCVYLPLCGNGCAYSAYVRYGDHTRLNCPKEYLDYVVRENLKMNYQFSRK